MSEPRATFDLDTIIALLAEYDTLAQRVQSGGNSKLYLIIYPGGGFQVRQRWEQGGDKGDHPIATSYGFDSVEEMLRAGIDGMRRLLGEADHAD